MSGRTVRVPDVALWNARDELRTQLGLGQVVRAIVRDARIDPRKAVTTVPPDVAVALGLEADADRFVGYELCGRAGELRVEVDPRTADVVFGHIALTLLDLIADPDAGTLAPRDPAGIVYDL